MKHMILAVAAALVLVGCGDGDDDSNALAPAPAPVEVTASESAAAGESTDCRIAAAKWANRMEDHAMTVRINAAISAHAVDASSLDDATSEVKVLCSDDVAQLVLDSNARFAEANFELSLCTFEGTCDNAQSKKVDQNADLAERHMDAVRELVGDS